MRITAGESTVLAIAPDDTLCGFERLHAICRVVHVVAPRDGVMNIEAVARLGVPIAGLEILTVGGGVGGVEFAGNPTLITAPAGLEAVAHIELPLGFKGTQSVVVNTSIR